MKVNDKVCVKVDGEWKKGNVIADNNETIRVGVGEPYHLNYSEGEFNRKSVKRFLQIDEEEAEIIHKKQFNNIYDMTIELMCKYIPNKKVEIDNMNINIDNINLGPCIMEIETIGAIVEMAGWHIEKTIYNDNVDGFPDIDVESLGHHKHYTNAVISFIKNVFEQDIKNYLDKKTEEAFAISNINDPQF